MRLVAITNRHLMVDAAVLAGGDWSGAIAAAFARAIARAVAGGDVTIQVREKDLDGGALYALVRAALTAAPRVIVNDRADVAAIAGAHGVHLPERGLPIAAARAVLPPPALVGVSRHVPGPVPDGADYVQLGPVFATPGKGPPIGLAALRGAIAVGGIDSVERARACLEAGARGIAVIRAAWTGALLTAL